MRLIANNQTLLNTDRYYSKQLKLIKVFVDEIFNTVGCIYVITKGEIRVRTEDFFVIDKGCDLESCSCCMLCASPTPLRQEV